jgi:hypothetical protein
MGNAVRLIVDRLKKCEAGQMDAVLRARESVVDAIDQTLETLSTTHEKIRNLDIKKIIDDQSDILDGLRNALEQSKRDLKS